MDWEAVQQRAVDWRWERGVYLALRMAKELVGAAVPREALDGLEPCTLDEGLVAAARDEILGYEEGAVILRPMWDRVRDFWLGLFVPKENLAEIYRVPPDSLRIYLYYFVHCKALLFQRARAAWTLCRGGAELAPRAERTRVITKWLNEG